MASDVSKHLDRAKRFLEKNRVEDAIEAYLAVLDEAPQHQEATQALGDLYARMDQPDRAAVYYGLLFDLLIEPKDETKALAIYNRFLRPNATHQPPERIARYAFLQQKQNHPEEAIEQYSKAAEMFTSAGREEDALFCWERIAQLDPENLARQMRLAEAAERIGKNALAARVTCFVLVASVTVIVPNIAPLEFCGEISKPNLVAVLERVPVIVYFVPAIYPAAGIVEVIILATLLLGPP